MKFPNYIQHDTSDCGPACLQIISKYYGRYFSLLYLRNKTYMSINGVSLLDVSNAAESIGFRTAAYKLSFEELSRIELPVIVHWKQKHFVVVYKINKTTVFVSDPSYGIIKYSVNEFNEYWSLHDDKEDGQKGFALTMDTTPYFYLNDDFKNDKKLSFNFFWTYLQPHKKLVVQILQGFIIGSILSLLFPFLTQAIVDIGINQKNLNFIYIILFSQIVLLLSQNSVDFIRTRIFLYFGSRINISIISDYLTKLTKLPISFYNTKTIGDLLQRIGDHSRVQGFLVSSTINIFFSFINFIVFSIILILYNFEILVIFLTLSIAGVIWIFIFLKKRKELDYKRFNEAALNQSNLVQLITGMQEIKLNNMERQKRWDWEKVQVKLFKISLFGLNISQYQQTGSFFINQAKNILVTILTAKEVINGNMTLGMMLSLSYILGQLNGPLDQLIGFVQSFQDAKISLDRLSEVHLIENEINDEENYIKYLNEDKSITLTNLDFKYGGPDSDNVLNDISFNVPMGKITAIVGLSGSGKTTLIKLLLKFYKPSRGEIKVGNINLEDIDNNYWRDQTGVVMQDGFIFNDTIEYNISLANENIDKYELQEAQRISNAKEFIETLPLGIKTKIGGNGQGISQGQRQRLLIARAVYKNPNFIFLDEATSDLDSVNEKIIMNNLLTYLKNRTVIVIAHRLSTVVNADQIIVMDKGKIIESGKHLDLVKRKNLYYNLIKNQLDLN